LTSLSNAVSVPLAEPVSKETPVRAFAISSYGDALHETDAAEPALGERDVLVEVAAAGLNQLDEKIRAGDFKLLLPYSFPLTLGHDVAGTVIAVGPSVTTFAIGDAVYARPRDGRIGAFAERIAIDEADVALQPSSITATEAAGLPLVALTAWQALVEIGQVSPGQRVLIHAGAGGVGTIAIQLAKHLGAHVATTASAGNEDFVRRLGADVVVDYRNQHFADELTDYDFVLDSLGADNVLKSLRVLRAGGKAVGISGPPTAAFAKKAGLNPVVRLALAGASAKVRAEAKKRGVSYEFLLMKANGEQLRQIAALVDSGVIRPVVGRTHPFAETPEALAALTQGGLRGKAVITFSTQGN
jgi:NADPH:quinone reductase-like Zn-dependent oxidoreductase